MAHAGWARYRVIRMGQLEDSGCLAVCRAPLHLNMCRPPPQAGRSAKRQLFLLPGGIERHLKIKTCSVSHGARALVDPRLMVTPWLWAP